MNDTIVSLSIIYLVPISIMLWVLIWSKGAWWLKLLAITLCLLFNFQVTVTVDKMLGMPTQKAFPVEEVELLWAIIEEPTQTSDGAIFVWVIEQGELKPKSYQLKYSRPLHEGVHRAVELIKGGKRVIANGKEIAKLQGQSPENGESGEGSAGQPSLSRNPDRVFHELPPPVLPRKPR